MVFLQLWHDLWGFSRVMTGNSGSFSCGQGNPVSIQVARGSAALLSSQGREIGLQDALRGESLGLSRVVAGNPRFL